MTCVLPCVITIIHIHAWLLCVIHMTLFRIRTMHGWHVSYHMSLLSFSPCMVDMCPNTCQNQSYVHALLTHVSTHVITKGHAHAWWTCVLHMAPQEATTMHGCHVSLHISPQGTMDVHGCHVSSQMAPPLNQVELVLLLVMTINWIPITPSFLVRFGRSWACWRAYQEHNLTLIPLLGSEARKALQIFV